MNKKLIIGTANFGMNYGISVNQKKLLDKDIIDILVSAEKMGIETLDTAISYGDSIERLGNVGVQKFKNCLVVDFGTATTFDVIKNNIYEGGVIAPGVRLSITNLYNSTALLPLIKLKNIKKSFGKNTKDALNAGFMWGYEGLINNIINKIVKTNKTNFKIILTGGYANFFKNSIKKKVLIDQNITIKGIAKIYKKFL